MVMARSLAHLFFFLLLAACTALAARDLPGALAEACGETQFPDLCMRSLSAHPDSRTASPRRLAELSVLAALEAGRDAAAFAHKDLNNVDDDGLLRCLDSCSADVEEAVARLSALSREPTDANFLEFKSWLSATLDGAAAYEEAACRDAPAGEVRDAAVAKGVAFDMTLRVALDLITEACFSMPPTAARAPAYGAGAPSYGAPSYGAPSYGGERRPRAPAPSKGYGHRRPRAPVPSPSFGGYGARMPLAPAPLPSRGYGHRRPRAPPHHRRPRVPTPSRRPRGAPAPSPFGGYGASAGAPSYVAPAYGHRRPRAPTPSRRPRAPSPSPFGGYGSSAGAPAPSSYGARRPRARAPAPSPSYGSRRERAPAPLPFGGYGSARRPRAPAPSPFVAYGVPAGAPAYGARRPGAPAPSMGASRPPAPSTYYSIIDTDETA